MKYIHPGQTGAKVSFKKRYGNYIGGEFVDPVEGRWFTNTTPVTGEVIAEFPRSGAADIEKALDAAHAAADAWGKTSAQDRSNVLLAIADRIEQNLELLALTETWDNGKPIRETLNADLPLAVDHFRYFAGCIRAQEGTAAEIDSNTVAYHIYEPLGVVGQIIPWNFPLLMAAWKLAPALAAGNCIVLKPAEQTPLGICVLMELIGDLLPKGVLNVVHGWRAASVLKKSPLPDQRRLAATSSLVPQTTSFRAPSNWAVNRQISTLKMCSMVTKSISIKPSKGWCWASLTRAKSVPVRHACWYKNLSTRSLLKKSWRVWKTSAKATPLTPTP